MPIPPAIGDEAILRDFALTFPQAVEEFPWDHRAIKVKGKIFVILSHEGENLNVSLKLPESNQVALGLSFTEPTGYGLGKSGWVTARFGPSDSVPIDTLKSWIEESYRTVAPKRLQTPKKTEPALTVMKIKKRTRSR